MNIKNIFYIIVLLTAFISCDNSGSNSYEDSPSNVKVYPIKNNNVTSTYYIGDDLIFDIYCKDNDNNVYRAKITLYEEVAGQQFESDNILFENNYTIECPTEENAVRLNNVYTAIQETVINAKIEIFDSDNNSNYTTIKINVINEPVITLSTNTLNYGNVGIAGSSTLSVIINNGSPADLVYIGEYYIVGDSSYKVSEKGYFSSLPVGGNKTIDIVFSPTTVGLKEATLYIECDNINYPGQTYTDDNGNIRNMRPSIPVTLTGNGI